MISNYTLKHSNFNHFTHQLCFPKISPEVKYPTTSVYFYNLYKKIFWGNFFKTKYWARRTKLNHYFKIVLEKHNMLRGQNPLACVQL